MRAEEDEEFERTWNLIKKAEEKYGTLAKQAHEESLLNEVKPSFISRIVNYGYARSYGWVKEEKPNWRILPTISCAAAWAHYKELVTWSIWTMEKTQMKFDYYERKTKVQADKLSWTPPEKCSKSALSSDRESSGPSDPLHSQIFLGVTLRDASSPETTDEGLGASPMVDQLLAQRNSHRSEANKGASLRGRQSTRRFGVSYKEELSALSEDDEGGEEGDEDEGGASRFVREFLFPTSRMENVLGFIPLSLSVLALICFIFMYAYWTFLDLFDIEIVVAFRHPREAWDDLVSGLLYVILIVAYVTLGGLGLFGLFARRAQFLEAIRIFFKVQTASTAIDSVQFTLESVMPIAKGERKVNAYNAFLFTAYSFLKLSLIYVYSVQVSSLIKALQGVLKCRGSGWRYGDFDKALGANLEKRRRIVRLNLFDHLNMTPDLAMRVVDWYSFIDAAQDIDRALITAKLGGLLSCVPERISVSKYGVQLSRPWIETSHELTRPALSPIVFEETPAQRRIRARMSWEKFRELRKNRPERFDLEKNIENRYSSLSNLRDVTNGVLGPDSVALLTEELSDMIPGLKSEGFRPLLAHFLRVDDLKSKTYFVPRFVNTKLLGYDSTTVEKTLLELRTGERCKCCTIFDGNSTPWEDHVRLHRHLRQNSKIASSMLPNIDTGMDVERAVKGPRVRRLSQQSDIERAVKGPRVRRLSQQSDVERAVKGPRVRRLSQQSDGYQVQIVQNDRPQVHIEVDVGDKE